MLHDFLYETHFHPLTIAIKFFVSHCQTDSNKLDGDGITRKRKYEYKSFYTVTIRTFKSYPPSRSTAAISGAILL